MTRATALYVAKRALIDKLATAAQVVDGPLEGVQVEYLRPGNIADRCIYGGGGRSLYSTAAAEVADQRESLTTGLYVRVLGVADDARTIDDEVERIANAAVTILTDDPELAGGLSFAELVGAIADVFPFHEQMESVLGLSLRIDAWPDWGDG